MSIIVSAVSREKQRIRFMTEEYKKALCGLPKGSLSERRIGEKTYYYLKYRRGKQIVTEYIPAKDVRKVKEGLEKRKHTEKMLCLLENENALADKILGGTHDPVSRKQRNGK